ncbi:DMT family transporter [Corynebacterium halotolerans]|uniref:Putative multidrug resistance membrane protein n=1 Tax=Corynebacterium halotolerans YIM 70093 = DSM 44683 TaxID=1121362 RepID=M1NUQ3_9CORY|nr:multidrug efflux SMR transporter [Corynebacterium halotolerans]AGF71245.1 putative multidrug resistance membrane protein [Corynebacterium halotolerans YIM 70093 = DSM 44683]
MSWLFLTLAIILEVAATLSLRMAVASRRVWYVAVAVGYILAFTFLSAALSTGMPLGVAYGMWTALGVVLTALLGRVLFKEPFTPVMWLGVGLIMGGVLLVELGAGY